MSATDDSLTRWNRRILMLLGSAFLAMSAAVFADPGASGEPLQLSADGIRGKQAWRRHNCVVCHQFFGMGGFLGPDLTNVVGRMGEETVAWVLRNGRGSMPDLGLSVDEVNALVVFLAEMNRTGQFPPQEWPPQWFPSQATSPEEL